MNKWAILLTPIVVMLLVFGSMSCKDAASKYETDTQVVQLAAATFYADVHSGWKDVNGDDERGNATAFDDNVWGRLGNDTERGHYYPTALGSVTNHGLCPGSESDPKQPNNLLVTQKFTNQPASDTEIGFHAIWMGLLLNAAGGSDATSSGTQNRYTVSPLWGENDFLKEHPLQLPRLKWLTAQRITEPNRVSK